MNSWGTAMSGGGVEEEAPERQQENRSGEMQRFRKDGVSTLPQSPPEDGEGPGTSAALGSAVSVTKKALWSLR